MTNIKCKACGRRYSYHTSDLCPRCGAYNKPQNRMRVDFDAEGNAELLSEKEFLRQSEAGKKREKVCYERKECHEDAVRVSRKEPESHWVNDLLEGFTGDEMKDMLNRARSWSGSLFRAKTDGEQIPALLILAMVMLMVALLRTCVY